MGNDGQGKRGSGSDRAKSKMPRRKKRHEKRPVSDISTSSESEPEELVVYTKKKTNREPTEHRRSDDDSVRREPEELVVYTKKKTNREPTEHRRSDDDSVRRERRGKRKKKLMTDESSSPDSSDDEENVQMKRKKVKNDVGKDVRPTTYYRSNLQTTIKEIKQMSLREGHLREIKRTPFWLMFNSIYRSDEAKLKKRCKKSEETIRQIIMKFDEESKSFVIGKKLVDLTKHDVQLIFGLCGGTKPIPLKVSGYGTPSWVHRCFSEEIKKAKGKLVFTKTLVFDKLNSMIGERVMKNCLDVARLTHCYLLAAVLAPNQNTAMSPHVAEYLEDFGEICSYDWCGYVIDMLKNQIVCGHNLRAGGCTALLPFWFCEHTNLVNPLNDVAFPRFTRWDLNVLNKKLEKIDLMDISSKHIFRWPLENTRIENDALKTLITFWKEEENTYVESSTDEEVEETQVEETQVDDEVEGIIRIATCLEKTPVKKTSKATRARCLDDPPRSKDKVFSCENEKTFERVYSYENRTKRSNDASSSRNQSSNYQNEKTLGADIPMEEVVRELDGSVTKNLESNIEDALNDGSNGKHGEQGEGFSDGSNGRKGWELACIDNAVKYAFEYGVSSDQFQKLHAKIEECEQLLLTKDKVIADKENAVKVLESEIVRLKSKLDEKGNAFEELERVNTMLKSEIFDKETEVKSLRVTLDNISVQESEMKKRDEEIASLRTENEKLHALAYPGLTQIMSDPKNLEHVDRSVELHIAQKKAADLERINEDLVDTMIIYHNIDEEAADVLTKKGDDEGRKGNEKVRKGGKTSKKNGKVVPKSGKTGKKADQVANDEKADKETDQMAEKTPRLKGKRTRRRSISPSTIVRGVKVRTELDDRKAIELTPQPSTGELIQIVDEDVDDDLPKKLRLDESCEAVFQTRACIKQKIAEYWSKDGESATVWIDETGEIQNPFTQVRLHDVIRILNHGMISGPVIDSWARFLQIKTANVEYANRVVIFSSTCFDLIAFPENNHPDIIKALLDKTFDIVEDDSVLLFPLLTKSTCRPSRAGGNHWTLLKLDLYTLKWSFYNSMRPRTVDPHLVHSLIVVNYVEKKLRKKFLISSPTCGLLQKEKLIKPVHEPCHEQLDNSVDCGIVVCSIIEDTLLGRELTDGKLSRDESGSYRKRMVDSFFDPDLVNYC